MVSVLPALLLVVCVGGVVVVVPVAVAVSFVADATAGGDSVCEDA